MFMVHNDWQVLGIDPTQDVVAIKKAYAARLKVTRPDDDAQAYQRLREAFDRATQWARLGATTTPLPPSVQSHAPPAEAEPPRQSQDKPVSQPEPESAEPLTAFADIVPLIEVMLPPLPAQPPAQPPTQPVIEEVVTDTPASAEPEAHASPNVDPSELAQQLHLFWKEQGDGSLLDAWPRVRAALDAVPLAQRDESIRWFAEWVLQNDDLPGRFVALLARHFEWGKDFRVERALGPERAAALQERLADKVVEPITDPQVLAEYADVLTLSRLLSLAGHQGINYGAWLFALLASPVRLTQRWASTSPRTLRALGVDWSLQGTIDTMMFRLNWIKLGGIVFLLTLIPKAGSVAEAWPGRALVLGVMVAALMCVSVVLGNFVIGLRGESGGRSLWRWFDRHKDRPVLFGAGLVALFVAWLASLAYRYELLSPTFLLWAMLAWIVALVVGVVTTWPRHRAWESLMWPVGVVVGVCVHEFQGEQASWPVTVSGATLWLSCCSGLLMHHTDPVARLLRRPWAVFESLGWRGWIFLVIGFKLVFFGAVLAIVFVLPLLLLYSVVTAGWVFAWGGIAAALTLWAWKYLESLEAFVLLIAPLVTLGLMALQSATGKLASWTWRDRKG